VEVYISTGAFRFKGLGEIIHFSINHGIDRVELSSGIAYQPNLLEQVRATSGSEIHYLIHNYFPPPKEPFVLNLASSDTKTRQRSCNLCRTAIDLAAELDAPFYSVHSGFAFNMTPDLLGNPVAQGRIPSSAYIPYSEAYTTFVENIINLTEYARSRNIKLLIENNVVSPACPDKDRHKAMLMASADEMVRLMQDVNNPSLGVLVDVGHVNVTATALGFRREEFVEIVAPHIGAFHLSYNDGRSDQNLPFDQTAWFYPLLRDFPDVPVIIEAYALSWSQMERQYRVLEAALV
jgi:sugar phosphate isomerase/epimerase